MATLIPETPVSALTQATTDGSGLFDVLMRATKVHLEQEFSKNRIKGPEYATVYLGALQATMQTALTFLAQSKKLELESQLLEKQVGLAQSQLEQAQAQILQIEAQTSLIQQQKTNLADELLTSSKQRVKLDQEILTMGAEMLRIQKQVDQVTAELLNVPKQGVLLDSQAAVQNQQISNLISEKQRLEAQTAHTTAETTLIQQKFVKRRSA